MNARNLPGFIRLVLAGTIIVLAAYWAGARYGQHQPLNVEAVRPNPGVPSWRGPDYNGISQEKNPPIEWSLTKNVAWKLALPGPAGRMSRFSK